MTLERIENYIGKSIYFRIVGNLRRYVVLKVSIFLFKIGFIEKYRIDRNLFFGSRFYIDLPSHIDIYLYGCKTSKSDIILQKYLMKFVNDFTFIDVGSSSGYYSLYFNHFCGKGDIYSIEPSSKAYNLLNINTLNYMRISTVNVAIGETDSDCVISSFDAMYSEYNTIYVDDYIKHKEWYVNSIHKKEKVEMITLDSIFKDTLISPALIKIDVEGSEEKILRGMHNILMKYKPDLIFRYWPTNRDSSRQRIVFLQLEKYNYKVYSLLDNSMMTLDDTYDLEYVLLKSI